MKATKIKMKNGFNNSYSTWEIDQIYIEGCKNPGFFSKEIIHNYLKDYPRCIQVNISPYPYLIPVVSPYGEKYVRSESDDTPYENLLKLPRV